MIWNVDQLQLPLAQRFVKEVQLTGHIRAGVIVGEDELAKGRALFLRQRVAALEG